MTAELAAANDVIRALRAQLAVTATLLRDTAKLLHYRSHHQFYPEDCSDEECPRIREVVSLVLK